MEPTTPTTKSAQPEKTDFKHRFLSSTGAFQVEQNAFYRLEADHAKSLITLTLTKTWDHYDQVPSLDQHLRNLASALMGEFTLMLDMQNLQPDADGVILAPAIPSRGYLFDAGLVKVANVIPHDCQELVNGPHSLSVNSVKMRPFHTRQHAESWLIHD